jgi:hypothetical protein
MKWSKALVAVAGFLMLAGVVPACGGDSKGPKAVDTGLPPEKVLGSLSDGEARQACQQLSGALNDRYTQDSVTTSFCTRFAVGLAGTEDSCNDLVDTCKDMAGEQPVQEVASSDCSQVTAAELRDCELTVADLEACSNDLIDFFDGFLNEYSCNDAAEVDEEDVSLDFDIEQPASCTRLENECPDATLPVDMMPPE